MGFCTDYNTIKDSIIIMSAVDIRHQLNDKLSNIGGHVGYGVAKSYIEGGRF